MKSVLRFVSLCLIAVTLQLSAPAQVLARSGPTGFADLAERLLPSVVNISTTQVITAKEFSADLPDIQLPPGSPFEEFFNEFKDKHTGKGKKQGDKPRKRKSTSLGSGVIIDPAGYIITNYHVIKDAEEITVILQDDTNLNATVVGRDKKTDLALVKVESKKPLTSVVWGDSDKARIGDWILAIGNPFGLGGTVTTGIISARARDINAGPYDDFLQTDAPINSGNSGGPMFNMDGELIGINTAIFSPSGGSIGIGFAIPSSMAKGVIDQLKTSGHTKRGWLGVRIQAITPEIAESLGMGTPRGALVSSANENGPAAQAHIEAGDVILTFDGKDVPDMHKLPRIVAETEVGKTVPVTVLRKGKELSLKVKVGELENKDEAQDSQDSDEAEEERPEVPAADRVPELDLGVAPLNDKMRKRFGIEKNTGGVVIVSIDRNGLAAEYGFQPGDVITEAAQQDVKSAKELTDIVKKAKKDSKPLLLLVDRKGDLRFIAINFGKKK